MQLCDGKRHESYSVLLKSLSDVEWLMLLRSADTGSQSQSHDDDDDDDDDGGGGGGQSVIDELLAFQMLTGRVCDACSQLSVSIQPSYILTLAVPHTETTLQQCLRQFCLVEQLSDADQVHCSRCARNRLVIDGGCVVGGRDIVACMQVGSRDIYREIGSKLTYSSCRRRSVLSHCPPYLIIQLLRFTVSQSKLTSAVAVPRVLSLGNDVVVGDGDVTRYELCALCCHVDSDVIGGGHYITYATADRVTWYKFDDVIVTAVDIVQLLTTESLKRNVYLLFYRRVTAL